MEEAFLARLVFFEEFHQWMCYFGFFVFAVKIDEVVIS